MGYLKVLYLLNEGSNQKKYFIQMFLEFDFTPINTPIMPIGPYGGLVEAIFLILRSVTMLLSRGGISCHLRPKSLRIGIHLWGLGVFLFFE